MKKLPPLGQAIEKYQRDAAITSYRIAKITGLNEATLSKLKRGITSPSLDTLERIAKVLGCNVSDILIKKEELE